MTSFLVIFCCCFFLFKLPFLLLGLLLRFIKPLALMGFGCLVGITLTTGVPNSEVISSTQYPGIDDTLTADLFNIDEIVSPAVLEAALSTASGVSQSIYKMAKQLGDRWVNDTESRLTLARNSSSSDFRSIDRSLRKRSVSQ